MVDVNWSLGKQSQNHLLFNSNSIVTLKDLFGGAR